MKNCSHHTGCYNTCTLFIRDGHSTVHMDWLLEGNIVGPSVPQWTEWVSYHSEGPDTKFEWLQVYQTMSTFDQKYVCSAPIAIQG